MRSLLSVAPWVLSTVLVSLGACSSDDPPPPPGNTVQGAGESSGPSGTGGQGQATTTQVDISSGTGAATGAGSGASANDGNTAPAGSADDSVTGAAPSTNASSESSGRDSTSTESPSTSTSGGTTTVTDTESGAFVTEEDDVLVVEATTQTTDEDLPLNLGSELDCDGIDENDNGIIDDVDVGKDGLCDCINMGFFGQIASDAGSNTTAFEDWLVERSGEVPVKHLDADDTLTADWLASLQVLIVGGLQDRSGGFTNDEIAAFDAWLQERGAGVITLNGYTADSADGQKINELLVNTGLGYDFGGSIPRQGVIGDGEAPPVWLTNLPNPDHPSVEGVSEIGVFYGYPVIGDGTVILRGEGFDLAMAKEIDNGRAFVFADEWITQDATWSGTVNGQADPCQQPCNEEDNICRIAEEQCARCAEEPCSDPSEMDAATCTKGCQPSCDNETARCEGYAADCAECTEAANARAEATPRLWLNTIRWLTPVNECKVDIPPVGRVR
jgi:hypothetical protein